MTKKIVYVVIDHTRDLNDGDTEIHILGVASTIDKANNYIKNYGGFYGKITNDVFTIDDIDKDRMKRTVVVKESVDGRIWKKHELSTYGRFMIE